MELQTAIQQLGFSQKEAAVHLAVLELGQATAYQIAKRSGLKKPTAYVILDRLIERSAVRKVAAQKHMQYSASDPVELFVDARSRIQQVESVLPALRAMSQQKAKVVQTSYFEGIGGIGEMYKHLTREMEGKTVIGFFAHQQDTPKELSDYWTELNKQFVAHRIKLRGVTTVDKTTQPYLEYKKIPKEFLELKGLPPSMYSSNISIEIYNDTVQIVSHRYVQGIRIQNPDIAKVLRQIFEIVWKAAPSKENV